MISREKPCPRTFPAHQSDGSSVKSARANRVAGRGVARWGARSTAGQSLKAASLLAGLWLAAALSGCATPMTPGADAPRANSGPDRATTAARNLPYNPLQTVDTLSGMQTRSNEVVIQAVSQLGTPYRWGGISAEKGFDCSGLTKHAYQAASLQIPRTSTEQYRATRRIDRQELRPGDLVFFRLNSRQVDHVGIYVGGKRFIHAPSRGKTVSFASLDNAYWSRKYVGAGRLPGADELQLAER